MSDYSGKWLKLGSVQNLLDVYSLAFPEEIEAGTDWYGKANEWARTLAKQVGINVNTIIDIVASLSPNNAWERNKSDTLLLINSWQAGITDPKEIKCATFNNQVQKALDILSGKYTKLIGGKVENFAHNIRRPETVADEVVTVDRWAFRAWIWNSRQSATLSPAMMKRIAKDYQIAAKMVGKTPRDFQAIVWLVVRRAGNNGKAKVCGLDRLKAQLRLF
jgi:hypothetical protein